ncbi:MAG: DUF1015 domain-containing protein [Candidatus Woesearchaeota archaeon]|jgi:uncharacterized protein (DUF1015 family)|nr:DUF1015 domain-containing protein [Candidatus Woesearchaeota archaeon]
MVTIKPFKGIRYNKEKVIDFSKVITPPYDVINEKQKQEFQDASEYNYVRLLLGKNGENGEKDYKDVAELLAEWQKNKILEQDGQDSIYIYSQTFQLNGKQVTRIGFNSLIKLEPHGQGVLPHEKTMERPFKDRLNFISATKANLGCIFMLYDDRERIIDTLINEKITNLQPDMEFTDKVSIQHKLWKISDNDFIEKIKTEMEKYQCIIADGHHRYRSNLEYSNQNPDLEDAKYTLCSFVNSFNEGLLVLPIDRFIHSLKEADIDHILTKLKESFEIEELTSPEELVGKIDSTDVMIDKETNQKNHVIGMYSFQNKKSYFLKLKDNNILKGIYPDKTNIYQRLDINILHKIVFNNILNISDEDQYQGTNIEYTKSDHRALDKLDNNKYQLAFFLNPPLLREIFLTARADETMPQKSTFFYPKIYSGLVINKIGG